MDLKINPINNFNKTLIMLILHMIEYRWLEALGAVIEAQGFEKATEILHITQSAVTQRIRQLEESVGQVLIVRTQPPTLTEAGLHLLEHYKKVQLLEQEYLQQSQSELGASKPTLSVAVNSDSLATWFSSVVKTYLAEDRGFLYIRCADQEVTHTLMTSGEVMGCISSRKEPFRGCKTDFLGNMEYKFVATRQFANRYFPTGVDKESFGSAPKMNFNRDDRLFNNWAEPLLGNVDAYKNSHFIPSSEQFPLLIREGKVCGMLPADQFEEYKESYNLVDLSMGKPVYVPLYWHRWNIQSEELQELTALILKEANF